MGREGERNKEYGGKIWKLTAFLLLPPMHNHDCHWIQHLKVPLCCLCCKCPGATIKWLQKCKKLHQIDIFQNGNIWMAGKNFRFSLTINKKQIPKPLLKWKKSNRWPLGCFTLHTVWSRPEVPLFPCTYYNRVTRIQAGACHEGKSCSQFGRD